MSKRSRSKGIGRFGARYGRTVRKRFSQIEAQLHGKHRCPSCGVLKVQRVSVGVWRCGKCNYTFSGAAYSPTSNSGEVAKRSIKKGVPT
ncbi:MAG: 50S ribosomal protein L37ae [Candidatus Bathyarchaeota archaeon]